MALKAPSENFECRAFARWLSRQTTLLFSKIPIGDNTLDSAEGKKLQSLGVRRGVPDFIIVENRMQGRILFIEMKRVKGGKVSHEQYEWIDALGIGGRVCAIVAFGYKDAKQYTIDWMNDRDRTARVTSTRTNGKRAASTTRVLRAGRKVSGNDGRSRKSNARRAAV